MANWARDMMQGYAFGDAARDKFDVTVAKRKAQKEAEAIFKEQDAALFKPDGKEGVGGWLYDTFGIGDAPTKTPLATPGAKTGAVANEPSDLRNAVSAGIGAFNGANGSQSPQSLEAQDAGSFTPTAMPRFAAAPGLVDIPQQNPVESPRRSRVQEALLQYGIRQPGSLI